MDRAPRTYPGRWAGLAVVLAVVVLVVVLNVVARGLRPERPAPRPVVTTVAPSG